MSTYLRSKTPHAVIVGAGLNALGVIRSLAKYSMLTLVTEKNALVSKSRFAKKIYVSSTVNESIIDDLIALAKPLTSKPALYLTEEKTVEWVSLYRDRLSAHYSIDFSSHNLMTRLQSKSGFQALAESNNSPVPKSLVVTETADLDKVGCLDFPCVFKPLYHDKAYSTRFKKAYKVENNAELLLLFKQINPYFSDMILQEWIEGSDENIYFCLAYYDKKSQVINSFSGRKIRSWPLHVGGTATCTSAYEQHDKLLKLTSAFVQSIAYQGMMGMEFKYDDNRKKFYMIEPTVGRTDYQHEIAVLSGCNILLSILNFHHHNQIKVKPNKSTNVIWCDEVSNANSIMAGSTAELPRGRKVYKALFRLSDPMPYIYSLLTRIKRRIL